MTGLVLFAEGRMLPEHVPDQKKIKVSVTMDLEQPNVFTAAPFHLCLVRHFRTSSSPDPDEASLEMNLSNDIVHLRPRGIPSPSEGFPVVKEDDPSDLDQLRSKSCCSWGPFLRRRSSGRISDLPPPPPKVGDLRSFNPTLLRHPSFCASFHMKDPNELPETTRKRGIDVGVCIILESADGFLLLTRRALHMRTFPGVWVSPGGHIESGESMVKAGLRELAEETGLVLTEGCCHCCILGLWESHFPPSLAQGLPTRHHVVVYIHTLSVNENRNELQQRIKLDPEEVAASAWIPHSYVRAMFDPKVKPEELMPPEHEVTLADPLGQRPGVVESKVFLESRAEIDHRLSTGTRYALQLWYEKNKKVIDSEPKKQSAGCDNDPENHDEGNSPIPVQTEDNSGVFDSCGVS
ncbi:unnamed protein product [Cyprideis torosa]|uniref:m7GpppN-mRNA hydrolase NUDT17 n=1 Tax=Cyprideis torosa TaxID=163714 RepID=A0A7R8WM21_9CRUS|nr:unnamed protein product [Cyprideis torosa]CAG0897949.1 unnamed protein product [Cyprideis torosa]